MIELRIDAWRAWAPGVESAADWAAWAAAPLPIVDRGEQPSCDFVPAMQRRRLSRLARIVMHAAWPLCADDEQLPFVFALTPWRNHTHLRNAGRDRTRSPVVADAIRPVGA